MMLTVLIVEDDFVNAYLISAILKEHFKVLVAKSGYEMLSFIEKNHPDVILMDINLGDDKMDGVKCLEMARNNPQLKNTMIYAVTGFASAQDESFFLKLGFNGLFIKPIEKKLILGELFKVQDKIKNPLL